jgi:hypothetical protein
MDKVEFDETPHGLQLLADVGRRRPSTWPPIDDSTEGWPLQAGDHAVITDPMLGLAAPQVLAKLSLKLTRFS